MVERGTPMGGSTSVNSSGKGLLCVLAGLVMLVLGGFVLYCLIVVGGERGSRNEATYQRELQQARENFLEDCQTVHSPFDCKIMLTGMGEGKNGKMAPWWPTAD